MDPDTKIIIKIKLADFGLSRVIQPGEQLMDDCGTLSYIAPDILRKNGYGRSVDMWSAGVLFYYMLCGKLPFKNRNKFSLFDDIKNGRF